MQRGILICMALAMIALCGCAGMQGRILQILSAESRWRADQTEPLCQRAKGLEESGELAMALDLWRLIETVATDQAHARMEIRRLQKTIADAAQTHYRHGMQKIKAGEPENARNHFLAALRLEPSFQPARQQLKAGFSPFPLKVYRTAPGDQPQTIAKRVLGSTDEAFLVTWFNDLPQDAQIEPQTLIILPKQNQASEKRVPNKKPMKKLDIAHKRLAVGVLEKTSQAKQIDTDIKEAKRLFNEQQFQASLDLAMAVQVKAPGNNQVCALASEARYRLAKKMARQQKWIEARALLEQTGDDHETSQALKEKVHQRLMALAQEHYRSGVKHFINEDLKDAVDEWEMALKFNPGLGQAHENIAKAKRLMQKIETLP